MRTNARKQDIVRQLSAEVHEDARRRFEELGNDLLGRVVRFQDRPGRERPDFSPNVFVGPRLTGADIEGEVILAGDRQGKPTGIAVAEAGGARTGLIGPGYEKLEALAMALAKVRPFKSIASVEFMRTELFEWVKKRDRGQESAAVWTTCCGR